MNTEIPVERLDGRKTARGAPSLRVEDVLVAKRAGAVEEITEGYVLLCKRTARAREAERELLEAKEKRSWGNSPTRHRRSAPRTGDPHTWTHVTEQRRRLRGPDAPGGPGPGMTHPHAATALQLKQDGTADEAHTRGKAGSRGGTGSAARGAAHGSSKGRDVDASRRDVDEPEKRGIGVPELKDLVECTAEATEAKLRALMASLAPDESATSAAPKLRLGGQDTGQRLDQNTFRRTLYQRFYEPVIRDALYEVRSTGDPRKVTDPARAIQHARVPLSMAFATLKRKEKLDAFYAIFKPRAETAQTRADLRRETTEQTLYEATQARNRRRTNIDKARARMRAAARLGVRAAAPTGGPWEHVFAWTWDIEERRTALRRCNLPGRVQRFSVDRNIATVVTDGGTLTAWDCNPGAGLPPSKPAEPQRPPGDADQPRTLSRLGKLQRSVRKEIGQLRQMTAGRESDARRAVLQDMHLLPDESGVALKLSSEAPQGAKDVHATAVRPGPEVATGARTQSVPQRSAGRAATQRGRDRAGAGKPTRSEQRSNMVPSMPSKDCPHVVDLLWNAPVDQVVLSEAHGVVVVGGKLYSWGVPGAGRLGHPPIPRVSTERPAHPHAGGIATASGGMHMTPHKTIPLVSSGDVARESESPWVWTGEDEPVAVLLETSQSFDVRVSNAGSIVSRPRPSPILKRARSALHRQTAAESSDIGDDVVKMMSALGELDGVARGVQRAKGLREFVEAPLSEFINTTARHMAQDRLQKIHDEARRDAMRQHTRNPAVRLRLEMAHTRKMDREWKRTWCHAGPRVLDLTTGTSSSALARADAGRQRLLKAKAGLQVLAEFEAKLPWSVRRVACGAHHTVVLTRAGRLLTWGLGTSGQLGLVHFKPAITSDATAESDGDSATELEGSSSASNATPQDVHSSVGTRETRVFEESPALLPVPQGLTSTKGFVQIACGKLHTVALDGNGYVWTWGCGSDGQLGHGDFNDVFVPKRVDKLAWTRLGASGVACGDVHTAVLDVSGAVSTFGSNWRGQLGVEIVPSGDDGESGHSRDLDDGRSADALSDEGAFLRSADPVKVSGIESKHITWVACGGDTTAMLDATSMIYVCGRSVVDTAGNVGLAMSHGAATDKSVADAYLGALADRPTVTEVPLLRKILKALSDENDDHVARAQHLRGMAKRVGLSRGNLFGAAARKLGKAPKGTKRGNHCDEPEEEYAISRIDIGGDGTILLAGLALVRRAS